MKKVIGLMRLPGQADQTSGNNFWQADQKRCGHDSISAGVVRALCMIFLIEPYDLVG